MKVCSRALKLIFSVLRENITAEVIFHFLAASNETPIQLKVVVR